MQWMLKTYFLFLLLRIAVFRSSVALSQGHYQYLNTGPHPAAATQSHRQWVPQSKAWFGSRSGPKLGLEFCEGLLASRVPKCYTQGAVFRVL